MPLKLDKNFFEFEKKLERIKEQAPNELSQFMKQQGELLVGDIKNNTPVDTGTLKAGWQRESKGKFTQIIYSDVEYVNHVNYGHRVGLSKTKVKKGVYMLQKGLIKRRKEIYKDLNTKFKEVIE